MQARVDSELAARGWRRKDLVLRLGYRNIDKGLRRVGNLGFSRPVDADLTRRVGVLLGLDEQDLHAAWEADRAHHEAELRAARARDQRYYLVIRYMPAVYVRRELENVTTITEALTLAGTRAIGFKRCIDAPDSTFHWLDEQGSVTGATGPGTGPSIRFW